MAVACSLGILWCGAGLAIGAAEPPRFASAYYAAEADPGAPGLVSLSLDSLGLGRRRPSPLRRGPGAGAGFAVRNDAPKVEYVPEGVQGARPSWTLQFSERAVRFRSSWSAAHPPESLTLEFDPSVCHATLLGLSNEDGLTLLAAVTRGDVKAD